MKTLFTISASALALSVAAPALAQDAAPTTVENVDLAPSSARIDLAREAVDLMWPAGNTEYMIDYMTGPYLTRMIETPIGELAEQFGVAETIQAFANTPEIWEMMGADFMDEFDMGGDGDEPPTPEQIEAMAGMAIAMLGDQSIKQMVFAEDEHFDERLSIVRDVLADELPPVAAAFEGPVREALAGVFAERFTEAELAEIAAFADTPAGQKFAREYITVSFEPAYYGGFVRAIPAVIPTIKPLVEAMETRMAHLPPMFPGPVYCADLEEGETNEDCIPEIEAAAEAVEMEEPSAIETAEMYEEWAAESEQEAADYRARAAEIRAEAAAEEQ